MAINTDLNVSPYFDDYDEKKQYHRVLFKPARPVQARELTQMQTILQNQIERFGSNIYKEGTVISGCDFYSIDDLKYIKLNDAYSGSLESFKPRYATLDDAQSNGGVEVDDYLAFTVHGQTSRLVAEIVNASDGFITRNPDLKTLYIKYKGTTDGTTATTKVFNPGETLTVYNPFGAEVAQLTTSTLAGYEGDSKGFGVTDGVIFQKGHFLYVQPQNIIVSKYSNIPSDLSVGFDIEEVVVNSNQDDTLLDNSQGFLNKNAPGADRLRLRPLLVKYNSGDEPEGFFAIVRLKGGETVSIRDITQFNSIEKELAARTYNQSGNYVSSGLNVSIEPDVDGAPLVVVSPGTAYSSGYELKTFGTKYFSIDPVTETSQNISQVTGVRYGGYLPVAAGALTIKFDITGATKYNLYTSSNALIGTCNVQSIEDNKIYIYNIRKGNGQETEVIAKIGTSTTDAISTTGNLVDMKYAPNIYKIGGIGVSDVSEISFVARRSLALSGATSTNTIILPYGSNTTPVDNGNFVVIDQTNTQVSVQTTTVNTDGSGTPVSLQLTLSQSITPSGTTIYYDEVKSDATPDFKTSVTMYVKTNLSTQYRRASLGVPDAYELVSVGRFDTLGGVVIEDLTSSFALRSNQKDKFYDISYIEEVGSDRVVLESGQTLLVRFKAFQHDNTTGDGFFVANSYVNIDRDEIPQYSASNGLIFDLASSFDFRPSIAPNVQYSITPAGAGTAINYDLLAKYTATPKAFITNTLTMPGNNSSITSKTITYLSRIDQVVVDSSGEMVYRKGKAAKTPSVTSTRDLVLAEITVPGNPVKMAGVYAPKLKNTSIRAYTMKDIANIESQINRILEVSATSMLSQQANGLLITDSAGNNRFKNGVLVDAFRDLNIADINNPEFFASVDKFRKRLTPAVKNFPVYLKRGTQTNSSTWPDIITKAIGTPEVALQQKYGTGYRNLVSAVFNFKGQGEIYPNYDGGFDVTTNPEPAVINIDFETPLVEYNKKILEMLKMSGADTKVVEVGRDSSWAGATLNGRNGRQETQIITEQFTSFGIAQGATNINNTKVGEFLTSAEFKPYMESKEIKILVYGLRPNQQHYFYFEEDDVTSMVKPGVISSQVSSNARARDVVSSGSYGDPVITDSNGVLTAIFKLPAETYLVGERLLEIADVDQYSSIDTSKSSYANFKYNAFNFDYEKQALTVNTRTPTFDVVQTNQYNDTRESVGRFIPDPPRMNMDPLAQTFYIKRATANGNKYVFLDSIEVFFKSKSNTKGVSLEIREVINGYPSRQVVPFGVKRLDSKELNAQGQLIDRIKISQDGSVGTVFRFDNPIRLNTEKEYALVLRPDGGDPSFNVFTAKLGERDLASNKSISQDWGDGVLFSSTNNRTWVPHQDEDLKFTLNINTFTTSSSTSQFVADDMEFFSVSGVTGRFESNEIAYWKDSITQVNAGIVVADPKTVQTADGSSVNINVGQFAVLEQNGNVWVSKVVAVDADECTLEEPSPFSGACTMAAGIGGLVSHFNPTRPDQLHIRKSNATTAKRFIDGGSQVIYGASSGAFATIDTVENIPLSFIQAHMYKAESQNSTVDFALHNGPTFERPVPTNDELYMLQNQRVVESLSNIIGGTVTRTFNIVATLDNNGNKYASPIVDDDISLLQAYKYYISNDENTTSKYVSREVTLNSDLYAEGLKVFAACHRPPGTDVKVYARFKYKDDVENLSDWQLMVNKDDTMRSNSESIEDYREFEFEIPEEDEKEFIAFQIKFVMLADNIGQTPSLFDYRAIAVT